MIKLAQLLKESEDPIHLDRHGSHPDRPKGARFDKPKDYNDHMGFEAGLSGDETFPKEQVEAIKGLLKQGYRVTGHSKIPDSKNVEVLMTKRSKTGSAYADVQADGKIT